MNELLIRQAEHAAKRRKALTALAWTAAILALLLVIGAIICLVMLGLGNQNFYLLGFLALGGMLGAAALGGVGFALFRASVKAEEAVYVGDTVSDVEACREAGIECLSAAWAKSARREALEAANAGRVVGSVQELRRRLGMKEKR